MKEIDLSFHAHKLEEQNRNKEDAYPAAIIVIKDKTCEWFPNDMRLQHVSEVVPIERAIQKLEKIIKKKKYEWWRIYKAAIYKHDMEGTMMFIYSNPLRSSDLAGKDQSELAIENFIGIGSFASFKIGAINPYKGCIGNELRPDEFD